MSIKRTESSDFDQKLVFVFFVNCKLNFITMLHLVEALILVMFALLQSSNCDATSESSPGCGKFYHPLQDHAGTIDYRSVAQTIDHMCLYCSVFFDKFIKQILPFLLPFKKYIV